MWNWYYNVFNSTKFLTIHLCRFLWKKFVLFLYDLLERLNSRFNSFNRRQFNRFNWTLHEQSRCVGRQMVNVRCTMNSTTSTLLKLREKKTASKKKHPLCKDVTYKILFFIFYALTKILHIHAIAWYTIIMMFNINELVFMLVFSYISKWKVNIYSSYNI